MTQTIKSIETVYDGYRFRSRLEAQWAVFFNAINIEYVYEKEGYNLGKVGWYLPDFWLPQVEMWAEVKPQPLTDHELEKCKALVKGTIYTCLVLVGEEVGDHPYFGIVSHPYCDCDQEYTPTEAELLDVDAYQRGMLPPDGNYQGDWFCLTYYHGYPRNEHRFYSSPGCVWNSDETGYHDGNDSRWEDTVAAAIAARSARFEHGESP